MSLVNEAGRLAIGKGYVGCSEWPFCISLGMSFGVDRCEDETYIFSVVLFVSFWGSCEEGV